MSNALNASSAMRVRFSVLRVLDARHNSQVASLIVEAVTVYVVNKKIAWA